MLVLGGRPFTNVNGASDCCAACVPVGVPPALFSIRPPPNRRPHMSQGLPYFTTHTMRIIFIVRILLVVSANKNYVPTKHATFSLGSEDLELIKELRRRLARRGPLLNGSEV